MILVLRALGVGDLATAVPALRGLRAAFPHSELALAAPRWLAPLADLVGGIDRLIPVGGLDDGDALPSPDLAVNLHGRGPQSHRLLQTGHPSRLWAFACPGARHLNGPLWSGSEHEVRRWCRLVGWYGVTTDPADLRLHRPRPDRVPVGTTIVHPGAKNHERRWPAGRFAAVVRGLTQRGHWVVITGSASERALAEDVAARAGLPGSAVLAGRTSLTDLAALVAHARLLISGDTGIGHLATAYGTASVLLFGPVSPAQWGPPAERPWHRALWASSSPLVPGTARSDPGARHPHPALMAVEPAQVLAAADEVEQVRRRAAALH